MLSRYRTEGAVEVQNIGGRRATELRQCPRVEGTCGKEGGGGGVLRPGVEGAVEAKNRGRI